MQRRRGYTGMRRLTLIAVPLFLAVACGQGSTQTAAHTPIASAAPVATASPDVSPAPVPIANAYGLLLSDGRLQMITPGGQVGASVSVAPPTLQTCTAGLNAWLQPPVSSSS